MLRVTVQDEMRQKAMQTEFPSHTSESLLDGVKLQNRDAWERLVYLYGPMVYGWCRRRGLQEQDAADIVQETFRSIASGVSKFRRSSGQKGAFRAWLWVVTKSRILDHHRKQAKRPPIVQHQPQLNSLAQPNFEIEDAVEESEVSSLVLRAAELVEPEFSATTWQAFWRVTIEEQPTDMIAQQLGISVAAVRQASYRVRCRLRIELRDYFA